MLLLALLLVIIILALMIIIGLAIILNTGNAPSESQASAVFEFIRWLEDLLNTFLAGLMDWVSFLIEQLEKLSKSL
jgi:phage-related minor tail protein